MLYDIRSGKTGMRRVFLGYLGYGIFGLTMFMLFWGLFHVRYSGGSYIISRLQQVAAVQATGMEVSLFLPRVHMASLLLQDKKGKLPQVRLLRPVLSMELAGMFPPRPRFVLEAEVGNGAARVVLEPASFGNWHSGSVMFMLDNVELTALALEYNGAEIKSGRFFAQGDCTLSGSVENTSGAFRLRLVQAEVELPFKELLQEALQGVKGDAQLSWQQRQVTLDISSLGNEFLCLRGGGLMTVRPQALESSSITGEFFIEKPADAPAIPESYPGLMRLKSAEEMNLKISGTLGRPAIRVL